MLLNVTCKKCECSFKLDIKEDSIEETKEKLGKMKDYTFCPGNHIELSSPINYLIFGEIVPGKIQTESEWLEEKKRSGITLISNEEIQTDYTCKGFSMGYFVGYKKSDPKNEVVLNHCRSPDGKRYYF